MLEHSFAKLSLNLLVAVFLMAAPAAKAQYAIGSFASGGGGTSTGDVYSLTGMIDQPVAGAMVGGTYSLQSGLWSVVVAIQSPSAPVLLVSRSNDSVTASWPLSAMGWVLEYTPALNATPIPWEQVQFPYVTNVSGVSVTLPASAGSQFFRLRKL